MVLLVIVYLTTSSLPFFRPTAPDFNRMHTLPTPPHPTPPHPTPCTSHRIPPLSLSKTSPTLPKIRVSWRVRRRVILGSEHLSHSTVMSGFLTAQAAFFAWERKPLPLYPKAGFPGRAAGGIFPPPNSTKK